MYIPKFNKVENREEVFNFVQTNNFGLLVTFRDDFPTATHIPMELREHENRNWIIQCHIAKANPQWKDLEKNNRVLAVFSGPHAYISSSWYATVSVPTWNYMAVHLYGRARILEMAELKILLEQQIDTYEKNSQYPMKMSDFETPYLEGLIRGVVGIEISVEDIQAKYKLSQNKKEPDVSNVVRELEKSKDYQANLVAHEMKKLKK